jgi:CheY-like chemotaxis protein/Tfp pilus assembly protein PilZ
MARQDDRRTYPRIEVVASAAVLTANGYAGSFLVDDLSASGALLIGDPRLEIGEEVKLLLHLPAKKPISLAGEVIRCEPHATQEHLFAIAFRRVAPAVEDALQQYVQVALGRLESPAKQAVLVFDDSPEICHALERDLRRLGRRALPAVSQDEAMGFLSEQASTIDTAFVDLRLGNVDGLEFLTYLSERYPTVHRILMSGCIRTCQLELAVSSGRAHAVLEKPWSRESLGRILGAKAVKAR